MVSAETTYPAVVKRKQQQVKWAGLCSNPVLVLRTDNRLNLTVYYWLTTLGFVYAYVYTIHILKFILKSYHGYLPLKLYLCII